MYIRFPKPDGMDLELAFETKVLKFQSLHYGLWRDDDERTLANLRRAQQRYTEHLIAAVPPDVSSVLDVGAGLGDNAEAFGQRGFDVVALSPDPNHREAFARVTAAQPNVAFLPLRYEDLALDRRFDLVLMSESSNYFPIDVGLAQTRRHLRPGGYLLLSGLFRRADGPAYRTMHVLADYLAAARAAGFALVRHDDITEQVAPNLDVGRRLFEDHVRPAVELFADYYRRVFRWKAWALNAVFRRERELVTRALYDWVPERLDSARFRAHVEYAVLLLQLGASSA
jgi:MPBQ/MSBQ methyltransferase